MNANIKNCMGRTKHANINYKVVFRDENKLGRARLCKT